MGTFRDLIARAERIFHRYLVTIKDAKLAGTFDQLDRSPQYLRATPEELLRSLNQAWVKIRTLETSLRDKEKQIGELREDKQNLFKLLFRVIGLTALITGAAVEVLHLFGPAFLRWIGLT